jgi:exocyst complex protein 7
MGGGLSGGGVEKRDTKDRFVRFGDALDEVESLHKMVKWDGDDEVKDRLKEDVVRMVVPTYSKFLLKNRDFSSKR